VRCHDLMVAMEIAWNLAFGNTFGVSVWGVWEEFSPDKLGGHGQELEKGKRKHMRRGGGYWGGRP